MLGPQVPHHHSQVEHQLQQEDPALVPELDQVGVSVTGLVICDRLHLLVECIDMHLPGVVGGKLFSWSFEDILCIPGMFGGRTP